MEPKVPRYADVVGSSLVIVTADFPFPSPRQPFLCFCLCGFTCSEHFTWNSGVNAVPTFLRQWWGSPQVARMSFVLKRFCADALVQLRTQLRGGSGWVGSVVLS